MSIDINIYDIDYVRRVTQIGIIHEYVNYENPTITTYEFYKQIMGEPNVRIQDLSDEKLDRLVNMLGLNEKVHDFLQKIYDRHDREEKIKNKDIIEPSFEDFSSAPELSIDNLIDAGDYKINPVRRQCPPGWKKLTSVSRKWKTRLNKQKESILNYICIGECGGGGDCMFHVIAHALAHDQKIYPGVDLIEFDFKAIRNIVANNLTPRLAREQLNIDNAAPYKDWDFNRYYDAKQIYEYKLPDRCVQHILQYYIRQPGWKYQGSEFTLRVLTDDSKDNLLRSVGYVVIKDDGTISPFVYKNNNTQHYIILYNQNQIHWQLGGFVDINNVLHTVLTEKEIQNIFPSLDI